MDIQKPNFLQIYKLQIKEKKKTTVKQQEKKSNTQYIYLYIYILKCWIAEDL